MRKLGYWKAGLLFFIAFCIQPSLLNLISIKGYTPNLLLCLVILLTFLYDQEMYGVVYGTVFGILYDMVYSDIIGPTPIGLVVVAIGILVVREYTNVENIINLWVVSVVSMAAYYFVNWGLYHIEGNPIGFRFVFDRVPWIMLYSMVLITILYRILIKRMNLHQTDRYFL